MDWALVSSVCRAVQFGALIPGTGLVVLALYRLVCGRRVVLCPGPRRARVARVLRPHLLVIRACRYDLRGLPGTPLGHVTCPECGRVTTSARERLRHPYRWRAGRLGLALLVLAGAAHLAPLARGAAWQRRVPTTVLIVAKRVLRADLPTRFRRELTRRVEKGHLSEWQKRWLLPALVAELRDDGVRNNATAAAGALWSFGEIGREQLERCLDSSDYQERQYAAARIIRAWWRRHWYERGEPSWDDEPGEPPAVSVSDALLRVCVEGLADDSSWDSGGEYNAWSGYRLLEEFLVRSGPFVAEGLRSGDMQERLLCAGLAARMHDAGLAPMAVSTLLGHLGNNNCCGDAMFAARALRRMGEAARPALEAAAGSGDEQQRRCVAILLGAAGRDGPDDRDARDPDGLWKLLNWSEQPLPPRDRLLGYGGLWDLD
jgi:hypothetical protein